MRRDDSVFLIDAERNNSYSFKMTKAKTALVLVMIISCCGLILSMTDAYPTPETLPDDTRLGNNSRLVITHVVKTIEFEVGIIDDDGTVEESANSTDLNGPEFFETDIELLNVDLLKEVVNNATGEENWNATTGTQQPEFLNLENGEGQTQQVQNDSLLQLNQTNS